jgi:hypothetical protein
VSDELRIRWAPKLRTDRLVCLYESDAKGMLDAELVDEVGWRLWERLADVVRVTRGLVRCPSCGTEFNARRHLGDPPDAVSSCPGCSWQVTAGDWHGSWEHRDLNGHCPDFEYFVTKFPTASTPKARMMLIDRVVHALHDSARDDLSGNFAARNFLEGSRPRIVALLDELAYGPGSTIAQGARNRWGTARDQYRVGAGREPRSLTDS